MESEPKPKHIEVQSLAEDILQDLELSRANLRDTYLKTARLMRLGNNLEAVRACLSDAQKVAKLESTITSTKLQLSKTKELKTGIVMYDARDEQRRLLEAITRSEENLQAFKNSLYESVLEDYYALRFSAIPRQIFDAIQGPTETVLQGIAPEILQDLISANDSLRSSNPADWSNAVHSCRKVFIALADKLYPPPSGPDPKIELKGKPILVGKSNWENRLTCWIEAQSESETYSLVVGTTLQNIGERLDAIAGAVNTGSHSRITKREQAERFVVYSYLLLSDILSLQLPIAHLSEQPAVATNVEVK